MGNPYMFTGRRYDDETGLYYYRARYYNPLLGRFMNPDPIGYVDSMNLYTYVGNNPINFLDPFGLKHYNLEETQRLLRKFRRRPWLFPPGCLLHAVRPSWGGYDFKQSDDTFTLRRRHGEKNSEVVSSDKFGNYLAGYLGYFKGGYSGLGAVCAYGDWNAGVDKYGPWYKWWMLHTGADDAQSVDYIGRGASNAAGDLEALHNVLNNVLPQSLDELMEMGP